MNDLIRWLKIQNIYVHMLDIEKDGYCLVSDNTIIISTNLDEEKQKAVLYHELKHLDHKDYIALYKQYMFHSKMESEAEDYMISSFIEECNYQYNYSMMLENFSVGMGYDTKYQRFK